MPAILRYAHPLIRRKFTDPGPQKASRKLREAAAFGHSNSDVQTAFQLLHSADNASPLAGMCRRYAQYHDEQAGENAVKFLRSQDSPLASDLAVECLKLLLESNSANLSDAQDSIIAELAAKSPDARLYMAMELQASTTEFFDNLYERGDQAANCLRAIVLESSLWPEEEARLRVQGDLFQLFLAKLMESGHDLDSRALKGIVLLLMADAPRLKDFIDEEGFDALMTSLDIQLSPQIRGQATLVISKFLEVAETTGQNFIHKFITVHVKRQKADDLNLAFSAAASLFPVAAAGIASLFLTEGFLPSVMPVLDRRLKSTNSIHDAFLALLNAACVNSTCRVAITTHCSAWLAHKISNGTERQNAVAATILAKLRTASGSTQAEQKGSDRTDDVSDLVDLFQSNLHLESSQNLSNSLEGLAYTSLKADVKEQLAKDASFLKRLLQVLEANTDSPEIIIGGLSTIANITQYPPNLSEEQKRMNQLKAYANASKPSAPNPLDDDAHISARCSRIVAAGVVSMLVKIDKSTSSSSGQLADTILLSLSKNSKERGKIAQQGAVKLLISHTKRTTGSPDASHALARILISLDPTLVFPASTTPHITDAIPPLVSLLQPASVSNTSSPPSPLSPSSRDDAPLDLLPTFEALLTLTNLASAPDKTAAAAIVRTAFDTVCDDLLLSNNTLIRRAAVELLCNLCTCPAGIAKFADLSTTNVAGHAKRRCHLLLAMADVEDLPTRRAAGGALAMLSDFPEVASLLVGFERGVEIVMGLVEDEDQGSRIRGLVVLGNLLGDDEDGEAGRIRDRVKKGLGKVDGMERVKNVVMGNRQDAEVLRLGVEVLKKLQ